MNKYTTDVNLVFLPIKVMQLTRGTNNDGDLRLHRNLALITVHVVHGAKVKW